MKKFKGLLAALVAGLVSVSVAACTKITAPSSERDSEQSGSFSSVSADKAPVLTVSEEAVSGKVRTPVTLPTATASDEEDGDLSSAVRIRILFEDDEKYVLPTTKVGEGALLSEHASYTPTKVGSYKITYFVSDSEGHEASEIVTMTVTENTEDEIGYNLAANLGDWLAGTDGQNSVVNDYGEIVLAGKAGTNYTGAVYKGSKIQNGDTVSFAFRAQPLTEVMFYHVSFLLTPSSEKDEPTESEGTWPKFFNMRIGSSITTYAVSIDNNNFDLFPQINVNLCDGEVHTISICITADEEKAEGRLWIDADTSDSPTAVSSVSRTAVESRYGEGSEALKIFDAELSGWLSFGANIVSSNTSADGFIIKSAAVNNGNPVLPPELTVGEFSRMTLNETCVLPAATAKDANDYSDLSAAVRVFVKAPGETEFTALTGAEYTPTQAGKYIFRYVVTDRSGNTEYKEVTAACSKGDSEELPVIAFGDDLQEEYEVALNAEFTFPVPLSVTDSFGDDLSGLLDISLTGREKGSLNGLTSYTFRAAGENVIRYEVEDYNGNLAYKEIVVKVTGGASGNILERTDDWYLGNGVTLAGDVLTAGGGASAFAYGGQKIYDEKVSMILNLDLASEAGGADGSNIVLINVRGGKNLTKVPKTANHPSGVTDFGWPSGLSILFSSHYGLIVKSAGYDGSDYARAILSESLYETFRGDVELSFKVTDVYEEGAFKGVLFEMWLDGERVKFGGSFVDSDGNVFLTSRVVRLNENLLQAGWLSMYINDADSVDGERTAIKALTIDGSKPAQMVVSVDKETDQSFILGEEYVLPVVTVTLGGEDVSAEVKKFVWTEGEEKPDLTGDGYTAASVFTNMEHLKGFTVIYVYNGKEIKTIRVSNSSLDAEISFGSEAAEAALNADFSLPSFTAVLGSIDVTDDVVVYLRACGEESVWTEAVYRPTVAESFVLKYYLYGSLLAEKEISVTGGVSGGTDLSVSGYITGGGAWAYTGQQMYNNKVYLKFYLSQPLAAGAMLDFALRGGEQSAGAWFSWPDGLRLRIRKDATWGTFFEIGFGSVNGGWFSNTFAESADKFDGTDLTKEHTLVYSVCDVYEGGVFKGIRVELALDGTPVVFGGQRNAYVLISESYLSGLDGNSRKAFIPSYLYVWGNNINVTVTEAYLTAPEGATPDVVFLDFDKEREQTFVIGEEYVLPVATMKINGEDVSADVKKFIWTEGEEKPDLTGEGYTEAAILTDLTHIKGFTVVYVYDGREIKAIGVTSASLDAEVTFGDGADSVALGQSFTLPSFTARLGSIDVTADVAVKIKAGRTETAAESAYTPKVAESFRIRYYLYGALIAEKVISVTGGVSGTTNLKDSGHVTGGGAWAYTGQQMYNNKVQITFSLGQAFGPNDFIDFALRGNEQDAGAWFSNSTGLRVFLKYDSAWGVYFCIGTGNSNGWLAEKFCESKLKYTDVDWTQEHTISYVVRDVYENEAFKGIRVEVWLDGSRVEFGSFNGVTGDGTYVLIPDSYLNGLSPEAQANFTQSYLFIWPSRGSVTVTEAYLLPADESVGG